jgi:hypothetical protein
MPGSDERNGGPPGYRRRCRHPGGALGDSLERPLALNERRDDLPEGGLTAIVG